MKRLPIGLAAVLLAACGSSASTTTTAPTAVPAATAALAVNTFTSTLEMTGTGAVYHTALQLGETSGQTGATVSSLLFVFRNGFNGGSFIDPLPSGTHIATNGTLSLGPIAVTDNTGYIASEIGVSVSYVDDSGHTGSASGTATMPVLRFSGLTGVITDAATGARLGAATVQIVTGPDNQTAVVTDGNGRYVFGALQAGTISLQAQASGYTAVTQTATVLANNVESDFQLTVASTSSSGSGLKIAAKKR